ncbi:conjugative transfer protein [Oceanobacter sp. RED65]|uniref:Conjugative transfer protein n=2 Tax=Bermanella marisrubri TaxID=207949 RepID=Q1N3S9_9GAMM|nr:conjugative transfer protein [Oceanobacter sp. RED65] [Bermanella marisrubri]
MHLPNKKLLLGAAISLATLQAQAVPFMPTDARAMGMGGTGVSSAEVASTVQFNPALLSLTRDDDHFGLKIPQISIVVADDDGFIDEVEDFDEESELDNSGLSNVDLLSNVLDESTGPLGLEKLNQALTDLETAVLPAQYEAAETKLEESVNYLDTRLFSKNPNIDPELVVYSEAVANDLDDLNNKALRMNFGANMALAIPSKKFSLALSAGGQGTFSGRVLVSSDDSDILRRYPDATSKYLTAVANLQSTLKDFNDGVGGVSAQDVADAEEAVSDFAYGGPNRPADEGDTIIFENGDLAEGADDGSLNSQVEMVGVAIADLGLTASRVFNIKGHDIAFGVTPKLQKVTVFDYLYDLDGEDENGNEVEFDGDTITENSEEYTEINVDLGAAYQFGAEKQFQAGLVVKNLLGKEFESPRYVESNGTAGTIVEVSPQVRAGISHKTSWTKVAFDLDLMENDPVAFEDPTQYASIGAELNVWRTLQLRAGYRANLAGSDQDVVTAGLGISPLAVHLDIGLMANASDPEKEAGIALEFGVEF